MKHTKQGFSLIEVLVAMSTFMIAASAMASLMYHSTATVSENNFISQAVACAQGKLEHLRTLAYEDLKDGSDSGDDCNKDGMSFSRVWNVDEDTPADGAKTIVVTVSWTEKGKSRSYELQTVYTQITT
jgi:type II secretory pathway pseudopilin PulG